MAGFRSPGFPLGLSAPPSSASYGFRTVLPFFSAGSRLVVEPPEEGGNAGAYTYFERPRRNEDDEVMAIIMAFVGVINGR